MSVKISTGGISYCRNCGQGWGAITEAEDGSFPCPYCGENQAPRYAPLPVKWWRRRNYERRAPAAADEEITYDDLRSRVTRPGMRMRDPEDAS